MLLYIQCSVKYISAYSEKLRGSAKLSVWTPRSGLFKKLKNLSDRPFSAVSLHRKTLPFPQGRGNAAALRKYFFLQGVYNRSCTIGQQHCCLYWNILCILENIYTIISKEWKSIFAGIEFVMKKSDFSVQSEKQEIL
jgi:hypothetical protein